jgi:four helix bundle protein
LGHVRDVLITACPFEIPNFGMAPHEKLEAWQATHALALAVYRVTDGWPRAEQYGLTSQVRRAAFSAASNIAEGAAKRGAKEFARFLDISLGSLAELEYSFRLAEDLGYLKGEVLVKMKGLQTSAGRLTRRLLQAVLRRA